MNETVNCPWCGCVMIEKVISSDDVHFYICSKCDAHSPMGIGHDDALKKAQATVLGTQHLKDATEMTNLRMEREHFRIEMNVARGQAQAYSACMKHAISEAIKAATQAAKDE